MSTSSFRSVIGGKNARAETEGLEARHPSAGTLCARFLNIEEDFDAGLAAACAHIQFHDEAFREERTAREARLLESAGCEADVLVTQLLSLVQDAQGILPNLDVGAAERRFILKQYAPQALLSGCVLQNLANASNCHESISSHAHVIHRWHVGGDTYAGNHAVLYRHLLESVDVHLPGIGSSRMSDSAGLLQASWALPAYWLGLSLFPKEREAEILGAALLETAVAIPALVQTAIAGWGDTAALKYRMTRLSADRDRLLDTARAAIVEAIEAEHAAPDTAAHVAKGFLISLRLLNAWSAEVARLIHTGHLAPAQAMVRLVRDKAKYAVGYHSRLKLGNQPFDHLIAQDPERFVQELGRSRWVSPGRPGASLLLTRLIAFGGPMFRVFSDGEIEVIRHWIGSLTKADGRPAAQPVMTANIEAARECEPQRYRAARVSNLRGKKSHVRDLYFRLLNVERYPETRAEALDYANAWLARSARGLERGDNPLPFEEYAHENLRDWFDAKALAQVQSYASQPDGIGKTRDEVIDEALQLCPMILIDGAWLQRWSNAGLVDSKIGALLYKIFSDEIGNGDTRLNHPNIYRKLMRQMCVDLPDFRTPEFARFDRFTDAAFSVPVFWLSVSQFPRCFLPETLGLNLAMELSGVGGAYRTARDELHHHDFSTLFVDLHNTIDNVSTGHSAMAIEAIQLYMDELLNRGSPSLVSTQWKRVWTGFRALSPPQRNWRELFVSPRYAT